MALTAKLMRWLRRILNARSDVRIYLWTISFMKPYRTKVVVLILVGIVGTGAALIIPRAIQHFVDVLLPAQDFAGLWQLFAIVLVAVVLRIAAQAVTNVLESVIAERTARDLQYAIFDKLRELGFAYFDRTPVGETLALLNTHVSEVQAVYRRYFPWITRNIITIGVSLAFLASINITLMLVLVPVLVIYYRLAPHYEAEAKRFGETYAEDKSKLEGKVYESCSAMLELRAAGSEAWDVTRLVDHYRKATASYIRHILYAYLRGTVRRVSAGFGVVLFFVFGGLLVQAGVLEIGAFIAFYLYLNTAIRSTTFTITLMTEQGLVMFHAQRCYDFMAQEPHVTPPAKPVTLGDINGAITFRNVHFAYARGDRVLTGLSLDVAPGERVGIVGQTGCGKSTLLKLIPRFYDPQEGEILLDGVDLRRLSLGELRRMMGVVFQETYLFGASIKANILFGRPDATAGEVADAAQAAFAHEFIMELPDQYDTVVGERGYRLSGGQKQRIAIARMFIKNPHMILLDEATSALDTVTESRVQEALDRLTLGRTTLCVAHRLATIRHYDRIVVLNHGRIAESGSYDELMEQGGILHDLVQNRLEWGEERA